VTHFLYSLDTICANEQVYQNRRCRQTSRNFYTDFASAAVVDDKVEKEIVKNSRERLYTEALVCVFSSSKVPLNFLSLKVPLNFLSFRSAKEKGESARNGIQLAVQTIRHV